MNKLIEVSKRLELRNEILDLLKEAGGMGLSQKVIELAFKTALGSEKELLIKELDYLLEKGLVIKKSYTNERLGIGKFVYKISSKGIDVLDGFIKEVGLGDRDEA